MPRQDKNSASEDGENEAEPAGGLCISFFLKKQNRFRLETYHPLMSLLSRLALTIASSSSFVMALGVVLACSANISSNLAGTNLQSGSF